MKESAPDVERWYGQLNCCIESGRPCIVRKTSGCGECIRFAKVLKYEASSSRRAGFCSTAPRRSLVSMVCVAPVEDLSCNFAVGAPVKSVPDSTAATESPALDAHSLSNCEIDSDAVGITQIYFTKERQFDTVRGSEWVSRILTHLLLHNDTDKALLAMRLW